MPHVGINLAFGAFNQPLANAAMDEIVLSGGGGNGCFFNIETPLRIGCFNIVPNFFYGKASWNDGDLYWFFGKPDIPLFLGYGLDVFFTEPMENQYKHGLCFYGLSADLNVISNEDVSLFTSQLNTYFLFYQISMESEKTAFSGTLGWLYAGISLDGELNSSNQPYFLFPYLFLNVDAYYNVHAGFTMLHFRYNSGIFQYNINFGALHFFYDQGEIDAHYKKKNLFGGEESTERINPELRGLGAALLVMEAALRELPAGNRCRFSLGLQKALVLP